MRDLAAVDPGSTAAVIARIASWASMIIGVSSISAPELASVSSIVLRQHFEVD